MAKILLSNLNTAIASIIGKINEGVVAARDTGIAWARVPEKVDFQAEVVTATERFTRAQTVSGGGVTRESVEGEQLTVQEQDPVETVVVESNLEATARVEISAESNSDLSAETGTETGTETAHTSETQTQTQTSQTRTCDLYSYFVMDSNNSAIQIQENTAGFR